LPAPFAPPSVRLSPSVVVSPVATAPVIESPISVAVTELLSVEFETL